MNAGRVANKVCLVTGAARGQGEAEVRLLVQEGSKVLATDVSTEAVQHLAAEMPGNVVAMGLDVRKVDEWRVAVEATVSEFGRIDALINNAGVYFPKALAEESEESYRLTIDINQIGVFLGMQATAPLMADQGGGSIVNISSVAGVTGYPGVVAYAASKWAVRGMTKVVALEYASQGVRVNAICPGLINTPMINNNTPEVLEAISASIPLGRLGLVDDVASAVLFLVSDEGNYITGSDFMIDGGASL